MTVPFDIDSDFLQGYCYNHFKSRGINIKANARIGLSENLQNKWVSNPNFLIDRAAFTY